MKKLKTIAETFADRKRSGTAAFIPYLTAGDRTLEETARLVDLLVEEGADIIELGVPFSDPVADGPVNQRAAERALLNGISLADVLAFVGSLRERGVKVPIVLFTYFNPIFKLGYAEFARIAAEVGVSGVLVVDLPPGESVEYRSELHRRDIDTIFIASPTSNARRLAEVAAASRGFVYYVSRTGVTGVQAALSAGLKDDLARLRESIGLPIGVGFGISTPDQAATVAKFADGVIVGSALVRLLEVHPNFDDAEREIRNLARGIARAVHGR